MLQALSRTITETKGPSPSPGPQHPPRPTTSFQKQDAPQITLPQTRAPGILTPTFADEKSWILNVKTADKTFQLPYENAGVFSTDQVDLIADISSSMCESLALDETLRRPRIPRVRTQEIMYRALRQRFPKGRNYVFNGDVRPFDLKDSMLTRGGTDLQKAISFSSPDAVTVLLTDDKGTVSASQALQGGRHKILVVVLLTSFSLEEEYNELKGKATTSNGVASSVQKRVNHLYGPRSVTRPTDPMAPPGFGAALLGQRDGPGDFLQVVSAYDKDGKKPSDQSELVDRIATAIKKALLCPLWKVTNPYTSDLVIQCPSGRTLNVPGKVSGHDGVVVTPAPAEGDFTDKSLVYVHTRLSVTEPSS